MSDDSWFVRDKDRIRGPFTQEQLIKLHQRGQLARFHDISTDRRNWVKARTLLDPIAPEPRPPDPQLSSDWPASSQEIPSVPPTSSGAWPETNIDGLLGDRPQTKTSRWRWVIAFAVPFVFFATGLLLLSPFGPSLSLPNLLARGPEIRSLDDVEATGAVGLVVVGIEQTLPDGTHGDIVLMSGTCFAVSDDGVFLTNRHIVEVHDQMANAADIEQRKLIYIKKLAEKNPTYRAEIDGELDKFPAEERAGKREELIKNLADGLNVSKFEPKIWIFPMGKTKQRSKYEAKIEYHDRDGLDVAVLKVLEAARYASDTPRRRYFRISDDENAPSNYSTVCSLGISGVVHDISSADAGLAQHLQKPRTSKVESLVSEMKVSCERKYGKSILVDRDKAFGCQIIYHKAPLTPEDSGGPLVNSTGLVLGINTWLEADDGTYRAISMKQLKEIIGQHATKAVFEAY